MRRFYWSEQIRGKNFVFLGLGGPRMKSTTLLRVSVQPAAARSAALVLLGAGAGAEPLKQFAVLP
jgi:hypothetical protein